MSLLYERELPESLHTVSSHFEFSNYKKDSITFVDFEKIMSYNYKNEELTEIRRFRDPLAKSPDHMVFNDNHTVVFISTKEDTFLVNLT